MKRILALLLALTLLAALCACAPEGNGNSKENNFFDRWKPDDNSEEETSLDPQPVEPELPTVPSVSYDDLVFTGLADEVIDVDGYASYYYVPQIALDSEEIALLNEEIMAQFTEMIASGNSGYPEYGSIDFEWNYSGDILSLVIHTEYYHYSWPEFYVYNISIREGRLLSDEEVLAAYGLTTEDYILEVQKSLAADWLRRAEQAADVTMLDPRTDYYAGRQYQKSLLTENVLDSTPYVGEDGALYTVVQNGSIAGADYYWGKYPVGTDYELPGDWTVLGMWAIDNDWS